MITIMKEPSQTPSNKITNEFYQLTTDNIVTKKQKIIYLEVKTVKKELILAEMEIVFLTDK